MRVFLPLAFILGFGTACNTQCFIYTRTVCSVRDFGGPYEVQVRERMDMVWASAKSSLCSLAHDRIEFDETGKRAIAEIDNSKVTVTVEAYALDQSMIKISAMKFAMQDGASAKMVKDKILADLERAH